MTTTQLVCGTGSWSGPKPGDPDNNSILSATPVFGGVDVSWSYPVLNPFAVSHTILYRGTSNNFDLATQHSVVAGNLFFDKTTSETPIEYFYWIKLVSINGTYGELIGPATATARPSIEDTIRQLSGKIDQGALAQELRSNIDHIGLLDNTISGEIRDRIAANQALGVALNGVQSDVDSAITLIETEVSERINANSALLTSLNLMGVGFQNSVAGLTEEVELVATANTALASKINTVEATVNGDTATGQVGLTAKVNAVTGAVESMYTAKVGVNGLIGGFGLYNDGTVVEAGFDVDRFWVGKGDSTIKPFIIENGEVFINRAVIQTLTADMIDTRGLLIRDTPDNGGGIIFGAGNALDWKTGVSGSGKPADGATVGAEFDVNISGQINTANADVYISSVAIDSSHIRKATITSAEIESLSAELITTGTLKAGIIDVTRISGVTTIQSAVVTNKQIVIPNADTEGGNVNVRYILVGAGGGGSGPGISDDSCGGNGGGGGGYVTGTLQFTAPAGSKVIPRYFTVTIPAGGAGGGYKTAGGVGGTSELKLYDTNGNLLSSFTAGGGGGGGTGNYSGPSAGPAGVGGSPNGATGQQGNTSYANGGANVKGGDGGSAPKLAGGNIAYGNNSTGANGVHGGGGAGGGLYPGGAGNAGSGSPGYLVLEFYSPSSVVTGQEFNTLITALRNQNISTQ